MVSYLQIWHNFTKRVPKEPCLCDVHHQAGRQADDGDQHVGKGEIHYEIIGHGAHVAVFPHCKTNWRRRTKSKLQQAHERTFIFTALLRMPLFPRMPSEEQNVKHEDMNMKWH